MRWILRGPVWDPLPQLQFDHVFRNLIAIIRPCAWAASPEHGWHHVSPEPSQRVLPRPSEVGIGMCLLRPSVAGVMKTIARSQSCTLRTEVPRRRWLQSCTSCLDTLGFDACWSEGHCGQHSYAGRLLKQCLQRFDR